MMLLETWLTLTASIFLVAAALLGARSWFGRPGDRYRTATALRAGALILLVGTLVHTALHQDWWVPNDLRQTAYCLSLSVVGIHMTLTLLRGSAAANPVADLAGAGLGLFAASLWPGAAPLSCLEQRLLYHLGWGLGLLGAGATVVAGSAGLALGVLGALEQGTGSRGSSRLAHLEDCLEQSSVLSVAALGAGLVTGAWWAHQSLGTFSAGDPRHGWLLATVFFAGMSLLAWRLGRDAPRWAVALAFVAGLLAVTGVLAASDLQRLLW